MSTVTWSPITSILENKPPGTVLIGSPGSGKTFAMQNIASNCLLTGQNIICLDGKNDMTALKFIYPDLEIIDINNIEDGALNPFEVLSDISSSILLSIITCMTGNMSDEKLVSISPIINDFVIKSKKYQSKPTFKDLSDYLYRSDNKDAQAIGTLLQINEDSQYGKLIFSDKTDIKNKFDMKQSKSQIISLLGLDIPRTSDLSNMTSEQRFTSAIVYIICRKLREILKEDSKIPTILFLDEAHILFSNPDLEKVVEDFLVLGRSLNTATLLATQNISHIPEGFSNLLSTKFMLRSSSNEAFEFLRRFNTSNMEDGMNEESIVSYITNCNTGDCFMIDRLNRGSFIHFTSNLGVSSNPLLKNRGE